MKNLKDIINEKLVINKDIKVNNSMSPVLKSIWDHFEMDKLYTPLGYGDTEPFLTKEEGEDMIEQLNSFLNHNKWNDESKLKYYCKAGIKFANNKIAKDFKKHNMSVMNRNSYISYAKDKEIIFEKGSLRFVASASEKLLGMYGPYGGSKVVEFNDNE